MTHGRRLGIVELQFWSLMLPRRFRLSIYCLNLETRTCGMLRLDWRNMTDVYVDENILNGTDVQDLQTFWVKPNN